MWTVPSLVLKATSAGDAQALRSTGGTSRGRGTWLHASRWWPGGLALIVLGLAVYLPGLWSIPPVDRDECRFAQASRQMFESVALPMERQDRRTDDRGRPVGAHAGGLVVPMVQDRARLNKPPLVYWLQAGSAALFTLGDPSRDAMWMYRVPSVLCALLSVLATWRLGLRLFDARAAWLGGAILALSPMVVWDAHQARADQLLLATTALSMLALARCVLVPRAPVRWALAFWLCVGLGVLAKGFITPMVAGLAIAAMCASRRSWAPLRAVRPWLGVPVLALVVLPWVGLIARDFGLGAYAQLVYEETFRRAALGSREGHFAPPGTHLVLLVALLWPGCLMALQGLARAHRLAFGGAPGEGWRARIARTWTRASGHGPSLFLLAWVAPSWLVFELSLAKLPHYTLPLYPALALLCARALLSGAAQRPLKHPDWGFGVWLAVPVGLMVAAALGTQAGSEVRDPAMVLLAMIMLAGVAAPLLILALRAASRGRPAVAVLLGMGAGVWMLALTLQLVAPLAVPGWRTHKVVRVLEHHDPAGARPLASTYHEDSLIFSTRGRVRRISPEQAGAWLEQNPGGVLIARPGEVRGEVKGAPPALPVPGTGLVVHGVLEGR